MTDLMKTIAALFAVSTLALAYSGQALAGDPAAGKAKADTLCIACHGPDGNSPLPENPRLAGQYADYLELVMHEYRSGVRPNPIMLGMTAALTDEDIANLAAWYASQTGLTVLSKDPID